MRSRRARAVNSTVGLALHSRVPLEPSEPIWGPIMEALRSEEEQDSDVYFVVRSAESASTFMGLTRAITTRRMAQKSALLTSTSRSFTASSTSSAASDCQWWQRAAPFSATSSSACAALRRCGSPRRASPPMGQRGSGWMCAWRM